MGEIREFEDLRAWQKARELAQSVEVLVRSGRICRDFRFVDQIRSAAASVMANIAEGFERGRQGEFYHFLSVAKGSCGEVRSHLYVALARGYLSNAEFESLRLQAQCTSRVLGALRNSVRRRLDSARSR